MTLNFNTTSGDMCLNSVQNLSEIVSSMVALLTIWHNFRGGALSADGSQVCVDGENYTMVICAEEFKISHCCIFKRGRLKVE